MNGLNFGGAGELGGLFNRNAPTANFITGPTSTFDSQTKSDLGELWSSAQGTKRGFDSAFNLDFPADKRNMVKRGVNTSEHTTVPIARWTHQWERALVLGNLSFAHLTGQGRDNTSRDVPLVTLPIANRILRFGQLKRAGRNAMVAAEKSRFMRRIPGFADGTLYDKGTAGNEYGSGSGPIPPANADEIHSHMLPIFGVIQDTTGIGELHSGSTARQARSSLIVNGSVQTHHIWGTMMPGTRLFLAVARVSRGILGADSTVALVAGPNGITAGADHGDSAGVLTKNPLHLHTHPYALIPCWSSDEKTPSSVIGDRFQFHPRHAAAVRAGQLQFKEDKIAYITVGVLTHHPQRQPRVTDQENAIFSAEAMNSLPLATISLAVSPL